MVSKIEKWERYIYNFTRKQNRTAERKRAREKASGSAMAVAPNVSAPHIVFVYGTLMDDEVVQALLKRVPPSSSAILNH